MGLYDGILSTITMRGKSTAGGSKKAVRRAKKRIALAVKKEARASVARGLREGGDSSVSRWKMATSLKRISMEDKEALAPDVRGPGPLFGVLREIDLRGCLGLEESGSADVAMRTMVLYNGLRTIKVSGSGWTPRILSSLVWMPLLTSLVLEDVMGLDDAVLLHLCTHLSLIHLSIPSCESLTTAGILAALQVGGASLQTLDLSDCDVDGHLVEALPSLCPLLSRVSMDGCEVPLPSQLAALSECSRLTFVSLVGTQADDAVVVALARASRVLEAMNVDHCRNISRFAQSTVSALCTPHDRYSYILALEEYLDSGVFDPVPISERMVPARTVLPPLGQDEQPRSHPRRRRRSEDREVVVVDDPTLPPAYEEIEGDEVAVVVVPETPPPAYSPSFPSTAPNAPNAPNTSLLD